MRTNFFILFFFVFIFQVKCQNLNLEERVIDTLLQNKNFYALDSNISYYINKKITTCPASKYFSDRKIWHAKGILKTNCYSVSDSILNEKYKKSIFTYRISDPYIVPLSDKKLKNLSGYKIYVYKRFYYCDAIYVLVRINNILNRHVLFIFKKDGSFFACHSEAFVN